VEPNRSPRSLLRLGVATLAATLALALLSPAVPAEADSVFTFEGGGYGHSVGMSQYGAYGMARDGYSWQEIVTHYFTDTAVAAADPLFAEAPLWVGIAQEQARVDFLVRAIGADAAAVTITRGDKTLTAQPGETITIEQLGSDNCRVTTPSGRLTGGCSMVLEWDGWEASPTSALVLRGCTLPDWNAPGGTVFKPCTYARGTMHIRPDNNTQTVDIALEIDIEDYVLGISESPYGWGSSGGMAALEAQAVAARSYAIHRSVDRGDPATRPWCWCQIYDTPVDQNYVGWGHGTRIWIDAVRNTEDMILTHPSETHQGVPLPIEAFYSSSTFGWTENSEHGFTAYVPYLRNVDDHWSQDPAVGNHSARWTRQFTGASLAARLPGMSTVTGLEVTACSNSGAALEITFTGSGGPRAFTTRQLRGYLGIRSMQIIRAGSPLPDSPACPQPGEEVNPPPAEGGPAVMTGMTLDDDAVGDSFGNADGSAQCGEVVEVFTTLSNEGSALTGVAATLSSADPYVTVKWNTTSTYPDIAEGGSAVNDSDWDLAIATITPSHHEATLSMRVVADNGGPWDVEVVIPVSCRTVTATASIGIADLDGNGSPEVATSLRTASGRQILKTRDAATGKTTGRVALGSAAWDVVALDLVPGTGTRVAALLVRDDGATRVIIADLATGERAPTIRFGSNRTPVALSIVPNMPGGGDGYAVLFDLEDGSARVTTRTADGTRLSKRRVALTPIDMERLDDLGGTPSGEITILGTRATGMVTTVTLDPGDGTRFATTAFGHAPATDLETLRSAGSATIDTIAVLQQAAGESTVSAANPLNGAIRRTLTVPIATAIDLEVLPPFDGHQGNGVAILGLSPEGVPTAIVTDTRLAHLLAGPIFDVGTSPIDLAVLAGYGPSGVTIALLGSTSPFDAEITLRDAISGLPLGTIRVP